MTDRDHWRDLQILHAAMWARVHDVADDLSVYCVLRDDVHDRWSIWVGTPIRQLRFDGNSIEGLADLFCNAWPEVLLMLGNWTDHCREHDDLRGPRQDTKRDEEFTCLRRMNR